MVRSVLAVAFVAGLCAVAGANGRPAATSTLNFQQGNPNHIVAGMTFGVLLSDDGGVTWHWMCEKAVGYGGMYDPDYAYTPSGAVFATTFDGLKVMRDRCTFAATAPGTTFISQAELGPNAALYYAAADPNDAKIFKSTDDGVTFPISATPGMNNDWWDSLMVARSDPNYVYLSGYRLQGMNPKQFLLFRSVDGGVSFTAMSTMNMTTSNNSAIDIVGIDPTDPLTVYARVNLENGSVGDSIYKSTTGGGVASDTNAWTKILSKQDPFGLVFLVRSNGDLVAATQTLGAVKSTVGKATCTNTSTCAWQDLASPPHINCLVENPATYATTHEVWACTHNYDSPGISADGYGIMKTTDLGSWTPVLRYQDIAGPVDCAIGTAQRDQCVESYQAKPSVWCCLEAQLGITSPFDCTGARDCGVLPDSPPDAGTTTVTPKGSCQTGSGTGFLLLALGTGALLWRRHRRR